MILVGGIPGTEGWGLVVVCWKLVECSPRKVNHLEWIVTVIKAMCASCKGEESG